MTSLLRKAFEKAGTLPDDQQDALAKMLLEELESETGWRALLANSPDALSALADEALAEGRA